MEKKVNIKEEGHCLLTTNEQIYLKATQFSFARTEHVGPVKQACMSSKAQKDMLSYR